MIHEILLALSGHPSPLFTDVNENEGHVDDGIPYLSPSEKALLSSIGHLSELHRKLREHAEWQAINHSSTICRAVATSIQQVHLARFQDKIVSVESKILTKDATVVGAYDIVPLAGLVGEFDEWHRMMAWYWDISCFMHPPKTGKPAASSGCSGAGLIDRLRAEQQTGFPTIENIAVELSKTAETAWLRQLAPWILYGKLPAFGGKDFFIRASQSETEGHFSKDKSLMPKFVTAQTASSILFIGKSLNQVRKYGRQSRDQSIGAQNTVADNDLVQLHLKQLSELSLPISTSRLAQTISSIRMSLSHNVLQHLLPMEMTLLMFSSLKQFFLLQRGEFAMALIDEANNRLQAREQNMGRLLQQDPIKALKGLSIKDSELQQTINATWKAMALRDDEVGDEILDFAEKHLTLAAPVNNDSRPSTSDSINGNAPALTSVAFDDLLFPSSVVLRLNITAPFDLILSQREIETYSAINSYLLALKRAQVKLSEMWRRTTARRDNAAARQIHSISTAETESRKRTVDRRVATRKIWASCSAAIFLLSEVSAYLEGEIICESWNHFEDWAKTPAEAEQLEDSVASTEQQSKTQRDPETLAAGHRLFLASLTYALLMNDIPFMKELRSLLGNVDQLIAFFNRLLDTQQKADIEHAAGTETGITSDDEQSTSLALDRARKKVDSDLKSVVHRLKQLDHERVGSGRYLDATNAETDFKPWKGGGVDRLLMKLEFGRMAVDEYDLVR